jgi:hypothetical protein
MTRKQARKQSVGMCQTMTLSVIAFLFVFAGIFSAQLVRAEEGDTTSDTSSEVSDSSESSESSESTESEESPSEDTDSVSVESEEGDTVIETVTVDEPVTVDTEDEENFVTEVFEDFTIDLIDEPMSESDGDTAEEPSMFASFAPFLVVEEILVVTPSAQITAPTENEEIQGVYTFTAQYDNPDYEGVRGLRWAIRADGLCSGDTPAVPVFGNVDGATTSPTHTAGAFGEHISGDNTVTWTGSSFTAVLDFSELPEGEYCFAFNPNPVNSYRQTVLFNHVIPRTGSIEITKDVLGTDEESLDATEFSVMLGMEEAFTTVSEISNGVFSDLPAGEYVIREIDPEMYDFVSMTSGETTVYENEITVQVTAGATTTVHIVNEPVEEECMECGPEFGTLVINKNVIDKDGDDISDDTEFNVMITPYSVEMRSSPVEVTISEDAPASIELPTGSYVVCEIFEEDSDYTIVVDEEFEMDSESPINCQFIKLGEAGESITFTNQKMTEENSRRSSRRHTTGGQVLGAFTGDSSTGGSCGMYLNSYMRIGANNNPDEVMKLQAFLNEQGYSIPVNGVFGASTEAAVKAFQKAHAAEILAPWGITDPTGYVYKMTRYVMNNMVCSGSEAKPVI